MHAAAEQQLLVGDRLVDYVARSSRRAKQVRLRVGPAGVEAVYPTGRTLQEVAGFITANSDWVLSQLERVDALPNIRRPRCGESEILLRGEPTTVVLVRPFLRSRAGRITVHP